MNVSLCCSYKEGRLPSHKSAKMHMRSFVTEIFSFEDKPMISRYLIVKRNSRSFPDDYSIPSVMISDDGSSISNHSSAESLELHK